jgi:hypothetical protein
MPASPGNLQLNCATLVELITAAYVRFANGQRSLFFGRPVAGPRGITTFAAIERGPSWINSERYDINAKAGVFRAVKS